MSRTADKAVVGLNPDRRISLPKNEGCAFLDSQLTGHDGAVGIDFPSCAVLTHR